MPVNQTLPPTDILWKPPPVLCEDKDSYRWFWRIVELLNLRRALGTFVNESPVDQQIPWGVGAGAPFNWLTTRRTRGIHLDPADTTKIVIEKDGIYNFSFSLELWNNNNTTKLCTIWARINDIDVESSARNTGITDQSMPVTPAWSYTFQLKEGDYFQLVSHADAAGLYYHTTPATTVPPIIPSAAQGAITVTQLTYEPAAV